MTRVRILFVDDEVAILDGLRDRLRRDRTRWEMVFAVGAQAALAELAKAPYDIVVSDIRMPEMDGAELLTRVMATYPQTGRLVLSGHADADTITRVSLIAHEVLSKPCDVTLLRAAIERSHTTR